ncbi:type II and III secretion system protein [Thermodesulfobacterium geofontis OPF15]|uniref:Type II and III secretion system protein n=1 Tax=Thermodesulfobacterium geofontis (strain OPF15) TaxID=795359 RepID=F8C1X1_THEGP|nr:type IV pilus secretin PilQ [Thermodesulfobacterium geofontis]AEH23299.1 type II and III secretion system protein [Thermodesulfobacterium geofontis OPF15]
MKIKRIGIFIFFMISFLLLSLNCFATEKIYLEDVLFLREPVDRLVFEFSNKPKYEISKEENKIKLTLYNVVPKTSNWMKNLPKEIFKEINASYEKEKLYLEFLLSEPFNFQIVPFANKVIVDLIWEKPEKPVSVVIKKEKIEYLERKPAKPFESLVPKVSEFPEYEIYLGEYRMKMPLTAKEYKGLPVTVDFQEADIHAVLRFLAEVGEINIIASEQVKGLVTLRAKQVPWDLLLDVVLANKGLAKITIGNITRVGTLEEIKKEAELYRDYMRALGESTEGIRREIENQRDILRAIQETEEMTNRLITKTFELKHIRASKVVDLMKNQRISEKLSEILKDPNKITFDPFTNILIVKATPKVLEEIEEIIKRIDKPRPQFLIEARIAEISDTYVHELGVKWGGATWRATEHSIWGISPRPSSSTGSITYTYPGGGGPPTTNATISLPTPTIVDLGATPTQRTSPSALGIVLGYFGKNAALLDFQLSALEEKGVARILSKPSILTLNREPATIKQGYRIPYLRWVPEVPVPTVEFIDAGVKFDVIPSLTPEGKILLDITIEKSTPDWSHTVQGGVPALFTNSIQTSALVDNGETLVIGGIKISDISETLDQVPGLGNIPGVGEAFKRRGKQLTKTELIVFITPKIAYIPIAGIDY